MHTPLFPGNRNLQRSQATLRLSDGGEKRPSIQPSLYRLNHTVITQQPNFAAMLMSLSWCNFSLRQKLQKLPQLWVDCKEAQVSLCIFRAQAQNISIKQTMCAWEHARGFMARNPSFSKEWDSTKHNSPTMHICIMTQQRANLQQWEAACMCYNLVSASS